MCGVVCGVCALCGGAIIARVPVEVSRRLPTGRDLRLRGIFIVGGGHTSERSVEPLSVVVLGLVPAGVIARARLLELLSGSPLRVGIRLLRITARGAGGASGRRVLGFCGAFSRVYRGGCSNVVVANTPLTSFTFRSISF